MLGMNLVKLLCTDVLERCESLWNVQGKFVGEKDGLYRLVHVYCPITAAMLRSHYPIKRMERIVNTLMQERFSEY